MMNKAMMSHMEAMTREMKAMREESAQKEPRRLRRCLFKQIQTIRFGTCLTV